MVSRLVTRFWPFILIVSLALGGLSLIPTINLYKKISTDPVDLLSPHHPNVKTLHQIREAYHERITIGIVLESADSERAIHYMKDLAGRLKSLPFVHEVHYRKVGYDFFDRNKLLFLDREDLQSIRDRIDRRIQKEKLGGFLIDLGGEEEFSFSDLEHKYREEYSEAARSEYYTNEGGTLFTMYVQSTEFDNNLAASSTFYDHLSEFMEEEQPSQKEPTIKLYLAGPSRVLEYRALIRDLKVAGLISGLALFLPLLIRFRSLVVVLLIFLPLLLGIPLGFSFGSLFIQKLSVITSFLFAILGGLGIESGIHLFSRYHNLRSSGENVERAIHHLYREMGRPILTSVASVAITFLLLIVNQFRGFSEFGLIAGTGLILLFILYFSFFPALILLVEKIGLLKIQKKELRGFNVPVPKKRGFHILFASFLLFSLYSFFSPFRVGFEYDSKTIRADIPEVRLAKEKQHQTSTRVNNPAVTIVKSREEADALKETVQTLKNQAGPKTVIDTTRSYYDLVPADQDQKMQLVNEMKEMLSDPTIKLVKGEDKKKLDEFKEVLNRTRPFLESEVPHELKELMQGSLPNGQTLFFINALPRLQLDDGRNAIQFAHEVKEIKMGVFWLLGLMTFFDIKLNFYNMVILPTVMGVSIDNAIHVMHRYRELGRGSLKTVLRDTGVACLLSSLTNAGGFAGLLFSIHKGLFSMGLLAVLGIGTCLLSTLVFLPMMLKILEKRS
ncbi:MAG: MMPL family transporter [Deltaproteobacteria bacterium]|nr:MMPL family transporter [Deltaproteobacteria bacterium]